MFVLFDLSHANLRNVLLQVKSPLKANSRVSVCGRLGIQERRPEKTRDFPACKDPVGVCAQAESKNVTSYVNVSTGSSSLELEDLDEKATGVWILIKPDRNSLNKLKRISIRNKFWFKELSWEQRRFIELVIMVVEKIRSHLLLKLLAPLVKKLLTAIGGSLKVSPLIECKNEFVNEEAVKGALFLMFESAYRMIEDVAKRISQVAQACGNSLAGKWPKDSGFVKYLMAMSLPQNNNRAFTIRV